MKESKKIYQKLKAKYTDEELVDAVMVPETLSSEEEKLINAEFAKLRMQKLSELSERERLLSRLLGLKYQIKRYLKNGDFKEEKSFGNVVKSYLKTIEKKQKELAEDIGIHPSRLNRIVKGKEKIGKPIAYRLERHSGEIIPAIYWWKLMQLEVEQELLTESKEKEQEQKLVKKVAYQA